MRAGDVYDYAVIRVVPRVERGELVNVGVLVSCAATGFIDARVEVDPARLRALDPVIDLDAVVRHLDALVAVARGDRAAGPIAALPPRERFHWLAAPRSAIVQTSPAHSGRCLDPATAVEHLMARMVRL